MANQSPPTLPPPETSGAGGRLQQKLAALLEELRRAGRKSHVETDGPLGPLLAAFVVTLEFLGACIAELGQITLESGNRAFERSVAMRQADEAAIARLQLQMEADSNKFLRAFGVGVARAIDNNLIRRVKVEIVRLSLIAASVLVASIAVSLAVGYRWGHGEAEASIHETESRLQTAFRNGLPGASYWAGLMAWNDISYALSLCDRPDLAATPNGRRACKVPLWIEPDKGAPDVVTNDIAESLTQLQAEARHALDAAEAVPRIDAATAPPAKAASPTKLSKPAR